MKAKETPSFDHDKPVTLITEGGRRFLLQDGKAWTYAEYDRMSEKWEPEPQPLDRKAFVRALLGDHLKKLNTMLEQVDEHMKDLIALVQRATGEDLK